MPDNSVTEGPITVTMAIDLSTVVGQHYVQRGEDDYGTEPETLGDRVAAVVAEKVYQAGKREDAWPSTSQLYAEAINRAVEERVAAEMNRSVTPTDSYGSPKGAPTTLGEIIDQRIATWLKQPAGDSWNGRGSESNLQKLINAAVGSALTRDVNGAIESAKVQVTAAVKAQAAQVLAETLTRAAGI